MKWKEVFPFKERTNCPFCGNTRFERVVSYDDLQVVKCVCGYVFMNPYLTEEGSQMIFSGHVADTFPWLKDFDHALDDEHSNSQTFCAYENALSWLSEKKRKKPGRLLDIGCGRGHFLELAKNRGWEGVGIDFSNENVNAAKRRTNFPIYLGRVRDIFSKEKPFDVISMWDYLEHVENPHQTLEELKGLLSSKGILIVACPNHRSFLFWSALALKSFSIPPVQMAIKTLYPATHLSYFDPHFLSKESKKIGYQPINIQYDETNLKRVNISAAFKAAVSVLFAVARPFRLSNRFILFLEKC